MNDARQGSRRAQRYRDGHTRRLEGGQKSADEADAQRPPHAQQGQGRRDHEVKLETERAGRAAVEE